MERAWAWVPDRPGLESALCTHQPGALSMALTSPNLFCALYGQVNNVPLTGLAVRNKWHDMLSLGTSKQHSGTVPALPFWWSCSGLSGGWVARLVLPALCGPGMGSTLPSPLPPTCPGRVLAAPAPAQSPVLVGGLRRRCPGRRSGDVPWPPLSWLGWAVLLCFEQLSQFLSVSKEEVSSVSSTLGDVGVFFGWLAGEISLHRHLLHSIQWHSQSKKLLGTPFLPILLSSLS